MLYGVMVAQQILVLLVRVRISIQQHLFSYVFFLAVNYDIFEVTD